MLLDMASENYHGTFGRIWQNAWRFMINFYQHAPPRLTEGKYLYNITLFLKLIHYYRFNELLL